MRDFFIEIFTGVATGNFYLPLAENPARPRRIKFMYKKCSQGWLQGIEP